MRGLISGWKEQRGRGKADLQQTPATPFDFKGFPPPGDTGAESVIGKDDSVIVNDTANAPWRPLVCMRIKAPGEFLIGSGILIKPNVILTAAHNVYRLNSKNYVTSIVAHVGVTTNGNAGAEAIGARVQCPPQYVACAGPNDPTRLALRLRPDPPHIRCAGKVDQAGIDSRRPFAGANVGAGTTLGATHARGLSRL